MVGMCNGMAGMCNGVAGVHDGMAGVRNGMAGSRYNWHGRCYGCGMAWQLTVDIEWARYWPVVVWQSGGTRVVVAWQGMA